MSIQVTVEELIAIAFPKPSSDRKNVNFKLVERILLILAEQTQLLHQNVELHLNLLPVSIPAQEMYLSYEDINLINSSDIRRSINTEKKKDIPKEISENNNHEDRIVDRNDRQRKHKNEKTHSNSEEYKQIKSMKKYDDTENLEKIRGKLDSTDSEIITSTANKKRQSAVNTSDHDYYNGYNNKKYDSTEINDNAKIEDESIGIEERRKVSASCKDNTLTIIAGNEHVLSKTSLYSDQNNDADKMKLTNKQKPKDEKSSEHKFTKIARGPNKRRSSIEVATRQQFEVLKAAVKDLECRNSPVNMPVLPDDKKLHQDILKGSCSLSDTTLALKMKARIEATETIIGHITNLLTSLANKGLLPIEILTMINIAKSGSRDAYAEDCAVKIALSKITIHDNNSKKIVTQSEMRTSIGMWEQLLQKKVSVKACELSAITHKITRVTTANDVKLKAVQEMNSRLLNLFNLMSVYTLSMDGQKQYIEHQINDFQNQLDNMKDQIAMMYKRHREIKSTSYSNSVCVLTDQYDDLVTKLKALYEYHSSVLFNGFEIHERFVKFRAKLLSLTAKKSDRDEIIDSVNDLAKISSIKKLVSKEYYMFIRDSLERQIEEYWQKILRGHATCKKVINDIKNVLSTLMSSEEMSNQYTNTLAGVLILKRNVYTTMDAMINLPSAAIVTKDLSQERSQQHVKMVINTLDTQIWNQNKPSDFVCDACDGTQVCSLMNDAPSKRGVLAVDSNIMMHKKYSKRKISEGSSSDDSSRRSHRKHLRVTFKKVSVRRPKKEFGDSLISFLENANYHNKVEEIATAQS